MKVLITGATGFIGNHVTRMCLEQGDDVRVMVMPGEDRSPLKDFDVEYVEGNLLEPSTLDKAVQGVEGIYHLAAVYAIWTKDPTLQFRVNVNGSRAMMQSAMAAGVSRVVYTSSIAALGINADGAPADETTVFNQWRYGNEYVLSKFISEQVVRALIADGLPAVIVNPGFPLGPGDRVPTPTGKMITSILKGRFKQYFDGGMCVVDVRDVARGHLLAMAKGRVGQGYLLTNREGNLEFKDLARRIGQVAGIENVATKPMPRWLMAGTARLMEAYAGVSGKAPATTYKTSMYTLQKIWADPSKAIDELSLPQTPIETAIADAVSWFQSNGYV